MKKKVLTYVISYVVYVVVAMIVFPLGMYIKQGSEFEYNFVQTLIASLVTGVIFAALFGTGKIFLDKNKKYRK